MQKALPQPKISVIVPVYNSEKFLEKCLYSLVRQTFSDFEVILIDDGSTDSSLKICEDFVNRYKNFFVKKQAHCGQGLARNLGIKTAVGEFLSFVDSDDFVHPDFLKSLYLAAKVNDSDISCCSLKLYFPEYKLSLPFPVKSISPGVYDSKEAFSIIIEDVKINSFPWNKLFKKSLFLDNNCWFRNMYFEDMVLIPELFFYANRVAVISNTLYNYSQHRDSTVGSMDQHKINDFISSLRFIKTFLEKNCCYEQFEKEFKTRSSKAKFIIIVKQFRMHLVKGSFRSFFADTKFIHKSINTIATETMLSKFKNFIRS